MTPKEREQKILDATRGELLTRADIYRKIGGGQRQLAAALVSMVQSGKLTQGEPITLPNNVRAATYLASGSEPRPEEPCNEEVFHGRAPSVFEWRGNFGLRS